MDYTEVKTLDGIKEATLAITSAMDDFHKYNPHISPEDFVNLFYNVSMKLLLSHIVMISEHSNEDPYKVFTVTMNYISEKLNSEASDYKKLLMERIKN